MDSGDVGQPVDAVGLHVDEAPESDPLIAPFFGSNIYVWGSVIFVFMLALAIGYLLGGLYSRNNAGIPRLCAILLASAATTLPTLVFGDALLNC